MTVTFVMIKAAYPVEVRFSSTTINACWTVRLILIRRATTLIAAMEQSVPTAIQIVSLAAVQILRIVHSVRVSYSYSTKNAYQNVLSKQLMRQSLILVTVLKFLSVRLRLPSL